MDVLTAVGKNVRVSKLPVLYRDLDAQFVKVDEKAEGDDPAATLYEFTLSSDTPYERYWGIEILSHEKSAVDFSYLKKNAAFLLNHDPDQFLGAIKEAWLGDDGKLHAKVRFSRSAFAQEKLGEMLDGLRTQVSIGYRVKKMKQTTAGDPEKGTLNEFTVTRWMPMEGSLVAMAADLTVGPKRDAAGGEELPVDYDDGDAVRSEEGTRTMEEDEVKGGGAAVAAAETERTAAAAGVPATRSVEVGKDRGADHAKVLAKLAAARGATDLLPGWLDRGVSLDAAKDELLERGGTRGTPAGARENAVDLSEKDRRKYSYARAIYRAACQAEGSGKFDGLEREVSDEIEKSLPADYKKHGGIWLPHRLGPAPEERAFPLDSATTNEGKEFVFQQAGEFIEQLRTRTYVVQMGARLLTGLIGPVGFPRQTGAGTAAFVTEESAITDSMAAFDSVTISPKAVMSTSGYTRNLLGQVSYDVEGIVRRDLSAIHERLIDRTCLHGSGTPPVPKGIYNQTGVSQVDMGAGAGADAAPTYAKIIDMIGKVGDANADMGSLGFLTTPLIAATLMKTLTFPTAPTGQPVWSGRFDSGTIQGYSARATNQCSKTMLVLADTGGSEHAIVFGNWNELLIGMWGAMEVVVDPYSQKKKAQIEITTFQMMDAALRHGPSFCVSINAIP